MYENTNFKTLFVTKENDDLRQPERRQITKFGNQPSIFKEAAVSRAGRVTPNATL